MPFPEVAVHGQGYACVSAPCWPDDEVEEAPTCCEKSKMIF
jgi:hypothetical protein